MTASSESSTAVEHAPEYVRAIAPYVGGKPIEEVARELDLDPATIVKLASNENPRGPSPAVREAIAAAAEPGTAAIAGEIAASIYGLPILVAHVEDEPNNTTRFWVLGRQAVPRSGRDETSLVMSAANRPGAVHALLEPFAKHGVSMSRIESRPARTGLWEYLFYVDLVGHRDDPPVKAALDELAGKAPFLKLLGSYPADVT